MIGAGTTDVTAGRLPADRRAPRSIGAPAAREAEIPGSGAEDDGVTVREVVSGVAGRGVTVPPLPVVGLAGDTHERHRVVLIVGLRRTVDASSVGVAGVVEHVDVEVAVHARDLEIDDEILRDLRNLID